MLRPWSQQARQLAPRRGTVAHSRESGLLCSHSHAETIDPHGLQDQLSVFQYHPAAQLMQLVFTFTRGSYRHPWPPGSALGVPIPPSRSADAACVHIHTGKLSPPMASRISSRCSKPTGKLSPPVALHIEYAESRKKLYSIHDWPVL